LTVRLGLICQIQHLLLLLLLWQQWLLPRDLHVGGAGMLRVDTAGAKGAAAAAVG
jgi:hypothetical protein